MLLQHKSIACPTVSSWVSVERLLKFALTAKPQNRRSIDFAFNRLSMPLARFGKDISVPDAEGISFVVLASAFLIETRNDLQSSLNILAQLKSIPALKVQINILKTLHIFSIRPSFGDSLRRNGHPILDHICWALGNGMPDYLVKTAQQYINNTRLPFVSPCLKRPQIESPIASTPSTGPEIRALLREVRRADAGLAAAARRLDFKDPIAKKLTESRVPLRKIPVNLAIARTTKENIKPALLPAKQKPLPPASTVRTLAKNLSGSNRPVMMKVQAPKRPGWR